MLSNRGRKASKNNIFPSLDSFRVKPNQRKLEIYKSDDNCTSTVKRSKSVHQNAGSRNFEFSSGKKSNTQENSQIINKRSEYFIVVLPLVIDENKQNSNQPILITISQKNFLDFGISDDHEWNQDDPANLFNGYFKNRKISFRIIASGGTLTDLKSSLTESIKKNCSWRYLKKIINHTSRITKIDRDESSVDDDQDLPYIRLTNKDLIEIFQTTTDLQDKPAQMTTIIEKCIEENSSEEIVIGNILSKDEEKEYCQDDQNSKAIKQRVTLNLNQSNQDFRSNQKSKIQAISNAVCELKRKKCILSDIDSTGIILRSVIDTMEEIFSFFCDKNKIVRENLYEVNTNDETFKIKSKNQIFLEGKFPIRNDLYEKAMKLAKVDNPCSIAYQLTRIAFPDHYFKNITLGKRIYSHEELSEYKKYIVEKIPIEKIPLALLLSFQDPLDAPFTGQVDFNLGQSRVDSYFDHIFRKAGFIKYSSDELSKVRSRIIRVLCQLNQEKNRISNLNKKDESSVVDDESEEQWIADIMKSDIFEENTN